MHFSSYKVAALHSGYIFATVGVQIRLYFPVQWISSPVFVKHSCKIMTLERESYIFLNSAGQQQNKT